MLPTYLNRLNSIGKIFPVPSKKTEIINVRHAGAERHSEFGLRMDGIVPRNVEDPVERRTEIKRMAVIEEMSIRELWPDCAIDREIIDDTPHPSGDHKWKMNNNVKFRRQLLLRFKLKEIMNFNHLPD